jgi:aspartyl protease family protein
MWKQVLPLFVIAVLVGWFMPAHDPVAKKGEAVAEKTAPNSETAAGSFDENATSGFADSGEVVLNRAADGHYYAQGNADGAALRFLVDTGATVVALTESDAQQLGHYLSGSELTVVGRGVSGAVKGKAVTIARLSVGNISAENVPAVIIPEGLPVSLLGQAFLSKIAHVTISDNRMTLKN